MTDLTTRVSRLRFRTVCEIKCRGKWRKIVIEAKPDHAILRLEGMRTTYVLPWDSAWVQGAKIKALADKAERKARKK